MPPIVTADMAPLESGVSDFEAPRAIIKAVGPGVGESVESIQVGRLAGKIRLRLGESRRHFAIQEK